jgi:V/A-type H+/Na+-transporting ATPase subunit I
MNLDMLPIEIIGLRSDLLKVLHTLRQLGCIHIDEISESPEVSARPLTMDRETLQIQEEMGYLLARLKGLIEVLHVQSSSVVQNSTHISENYLVEARQGVEELLPKVQVLTARQERLQAELVSLPRYEATLRKLLPIIPASARDPENASVGVLISRVYVSVLDTVAKQIFDLTNGRAEVVASDVDSSTRAMLIVFPKMHTVEVEALLGREDVSRLRLPEELGKGTPDVILATLHRRMTTIPEEIKQADHELAKLAYEKGEHLILWRDQLNQELNTLAVLSKFGETDMTFILVGWLPEKDYDLVRESLREDIGETLLVQKLPLSPELRKQAPVVLQNPRATRPFESLVKLLSLPRYGRIDPTRLMSFFLPFFFGMILGDVGYGALLLLITLALISRFKPGVLRDILIVLGMGAGWSMIFGFLFGEAFGTLGEERLGMHPIWFSRTSSEHVAALLLMTIAVGAVHITLGLILGVWEAVRDKSRSHLLERGGMLVGLVSLFFIVGVLTEYLPRGLMTPAISGLILGIVLLGSSLGWLGVIMGPIEFIGLIGNVLSYLRIAAIGLASVYLAKVANDVAGMVGNLIVGIILAVLIHTLNLVLGAFSPTIHSLRLHYVEFFRKFYEGGGRPYEPFKSQGFFEN